jgi:hypothetical protein
MPRAGVDAYEFALFDVKGHYCPDDQNGKRNLETSSGASYFRGQLFLELAGPAASSVLPMPMIYRSFLELPGPAVSSAEPLPMSYRSFIDEDRVPSAAVVLPASVDEELLDLLFDGPGRKEWVLTGLCHKRTTPS